MKWTACALLSLFVWASISPAQSERPQTLDSRGVPQRQGTPDFALDTTAWPPAPAPPSRPANTSGATVSVDELKLSSAARKEWTRFQQSLNAGNLQESVKHLSKAVQIDPRIAAAHQNLGACYVRLNEYEKAVSEFQAASKLDKHMIQPVLGLAGAYLVLRRFADAEAASRHAVDMEPENSMGRYLLGKALSLQDKDTPEAEKLLRESCVQFPDAHLALAHLLLNRNDKDEAAEQLRQYVHQAETTQKEKDTLNCAIEKLTVAPSESACVLNPAILQARD